MHLHYPILLRTIDKFNINYRFRKAGKYSSGEIEAKEANGESKVGCGKNNRISETINVLASTQEAPRAVREQVPLPGYMNHG